MLSSRVPDLTALQLLLAVQRTGSLSAAGASLQLTQQAASLRMQSMEAQVGVPLVLRSRQGSRLTQEGVLVAQWADGVLQAAERLDTGIDSLQTERDARLRVTASLTIAEHLIPRWFLAVRASQQRSGVALTDFELTTANSDAVIRAVYAATSDVGFIETPGPPTGLRSRTVARDHLVVVVAPTHPWARRSRQIGVAELAATRLVTRERGSGTREVFERAVVRQLPAGASMAAPAIELSGTAAVRAAVSAGTAPGALSALAVADDLALRRLVEVPVLGLDLSRKLRAVWRGAAQPPAGPARGVDRGGGLVTDATAKLSAAPVAAVVTDRHSRKTTRPSRYFTKTEPMQTRSSAETRCVQRELWNRSILLAADTSLDHDHNPGHPLDHVRQPFAFCFAGFHPPRSRLGCGREDGFLLR